MAISNLASGLRPGVCTSGTRPSAPYEGQMIYETDTNRVLVWDNAAWVMIADTDQPPGMQLIKTQTVGSGVSSVTVGNAFSSEYDIYRVTYIGGTIGSANLDLKFQLRTGSTTSTTGYYSTLFYWSGSSLTAYNQDNAPEWLNAGGAANLAVRMDIEVQGPYLSQRTTYFSNSPRNDIRGISTGYHTADTSYDGFVLSPSASTITGGTIRVYGYRN